MTRAAFVAIALVLAPPSCAKLLGQKPPDTASVDPTPSTPPPPPSATTPPVFTADPGPPPTVTTGAGTPANPDLAKARAAADAKEWKKVKSLLEKKARAGKASPEEAQLVFEACTQTKDRACIEALKARSGGGGGRPGDDPAQRL